MEEKIPPSLYKKAAEAGLIATCLGTPWPTKYRPEITICGYKMDNFNTFHEFTVLDEINRVASGGVMGFLLAGTTIGAPPVLMFGPEEM